MGGHAIKSPAALKGRTELQKRKVESRKRSSEACLDGLAFPVPLCSPLSLDGGPWLSKNIPASGRHHGAWPACGFVAGPNSNAGKIA